MKFVTISFLRISFNFNFIFKNPTIKKRKTLAQKNFQPKKNNKLNKKKKLSNNKIKKLNLKKI